ncbi:MAG: hypothetical protein ACRCUP_04465 [Mycoplasmatales bacterium]
MDTLTFLKSNNLSYRDQNAQIIFENHLHELRLRVENGETLEIELESEMLDSIKPETMKLANKLVEALGIRLEKNKETEIFLIATHLVMMEENNE